MSTNFMTVKDPEEISKLQGRTRSKLAKMFFARSGAISKKWLHYLDIYDRYLSSYRGKAIKFLEIGIADGGSFNVWRPYLGDNATIYGIDILPECRARVDALNLNCHARIGSQNDPKFLQEVIAEMGGLDIVLDDGSHIAEHQLTSFRTLFPLLAEGGLYICEDLHTSYWRDWQGGFRKSGTFIESIKNMCDSIHAWYGPTPNQFSEMKLHEQIHGIHLHDSIVVIEKARVSPPIMLIK